MNAKPIVRVGTLFGLLAAGCTAAHDGGSASSSSADTAGASGWYTSQECEDVGSVDPIAGVPHTWKVCNGPRGSFLTTYRAYAQQVVGLPMEDAHCDDHDCFQTFERVRMNAAGAINGASGVCGYGACLSFSGIDAMAVDHPDWHVAPGLNTNCQRLDVHQRSITDCITNIDPLLAQIYENNGGLNAFGYPVSAIEQDCPWTDGPPRPCVYFERAKFGFFPEYDPAYRWESMLSGKAVLRSQPIVLALGDSLPFGYDVTVSPAVEVVSTHSYVDALAAIARNQPHTQTVDVVNLSLPGESSESLLTGLTRDAPDMWNNMHAYPAHHEWEHGWFGSGDDSSGARTTQMAYAVRYLAEHRASVKMITITVGVNDWGLPGIVNNPFAYTARIHSAYQEIFRYLKDVHVPIRIVEYYSNTKGFVGNVGLGVFQAAAEGAYLDLVNGGQPVPTNVKFLHPDDVLKPHAKSVTGDDNKFCEAGLFVRVGSGCDSHPSDVAARLIAAQVWDSLSSAEHDALTHAAQ